MDRFETLFNLAECGLWSLIAIAVALGAFRHTGKKRRILAIAAVAFALFGISDWIEADTGSWWDPPWLLAWKAGCLFVLLFALRAWLRLSKIENASQSAAGPEPAHANNTSSPQDVR